MTEKDIIQVIMAFLKTVPGCFAWKEHGGMYGRAGLPDIICCISGRFIAFEVKTLTGTLTKLQSVTLRKIEAAGGAAQKVQSIEEVKSILNSLEVLTDDDSMGIS